MSNQPPKPKIITVYETKKRRSSSENETLAALLLLFISTLCVLFGAALNWIAQMISALSVFIPIFYAVQYQQRPKRFAFLIPKKKINYFFFWLAILTLIAVEVLYAAHHYQVYSYPISFRKLKDWMTIKTDTLTWIGIGNFIVGWLALTLTTKAKK